MAVVTNYPKHSGEWLKHELDPELNREQVTILAGSGVLKTGTPLGKIATAGATSAAKSGGNTGGGTLTLDATPPVLADAVAGVYKVRCTSAATDGGTFEVENPAGVVIGSVAVGATWAEGVKFVIADSGTDFAVGDGFDVTVAAGSGKYVPVAPAAVNGAQVAVGVLLHGVDASGGSDVQAVAVIGNARIAPLALEWPSAVDDQNKKNAVLAQLALRGFKTAYQS